MFVIDAVLHVDDAEGRGYVAKLRLQYMRRGRRAEWTHPAPVVEEQGGLLLRAGDRNSKLSVEVDAERRAREIGEHGLDPAFVDGLAFDVGEGIDFRALGQKLHRSHTVAPDPFEQAVVIGSLGSCSFGDLLSHTRIVGQKILENGRDGYAAIGGLAQRERQRDGERVLPVQPAAIIAEADCAAGLLYQSADRAVIDQHLQRRMRAVTRHQKMSWISVRLPFDRLSTMRSRSSAANRA